MSSAIRPGAATSLIAGDLADPAAPRDIWDAALDELGGRIDVLVNNAGIFEGVADDAADDEWHAAWARTMTINLQAAADLCRLAVAHFRDRGSGGPDRQRRQPRRLPRRQPAALALCRVEGGDGRHDQDHRARLCGRRHPRLRGRARLHRVRDDRGISRRAAAARRSSPTSRSAGSRPRTKSPRSSAGWRSTRRLRRPAASSTSMAPAMFASLASSPPRSGSSFRSASRRAIEQPRAPIEIAGPRCARHATARTTGQARPAGAHPRQHLFRRHVRHLSILITVAPRAIS